jgi:hypothetical protein
MASRWLWIGVAATCALVGFTCGWYVGLRRGADAMAAIDAGNRVTRAVYDIRTSLALLEKQDPAAFNWDSEARIRRALRELGEDRSIVDSFRTCSEDERRTMDDVRLYLLGHPLEPASPPLDFEQRGAAFCGKPATQASR